jgi:hypothetical protein
MYSVVMKLTGPIMPIGDSGEDARRLENLKALCFLVDRLVSDIDDVASARDFHMASVKAAKDYASNFLTKTLGIEDN